MIHDSVVGRGVSWLRKQLAQSQADRTNRRLFIGKDLNIQFRHCFLLDERVAKLKWLKSERLTGKAEIKRRQTYRKNLNEQLASGAEDLASEMTVVRSEFERSENSPVQVLMSRLMANAYDWHNYGKSVIGNKADIERVPIPSLRAFYEKYYRPDNVIVVVSGKFDPKKAVASTVSHFGALEKPKTPLPKTYTTEPIQDGERIVYLNRTGEVPAVGVGYHIPTS